MKGLKLTNPALNTSIQNLTGVEYFQQFIPSLVLLVIIIGALIFIFILLIGAVQWMTAGGDKTSIESARGRVTNGLIGVFILLSVFALIKIIETFFSINILTLDIGPIIIK